MGFLARGSLFFNEKTRLTCVCAFFVVTSRAPTSFVHAHSPTSKLQLRYAAHTQNSLEIFTKKVYTLSSAIQYLILKRA